MKRPTIVETLVFALLAGGIYNHMHSTTGATPAADRSLAPKVASRMLVRRIENGSRGAGDEALATLRSDPSFTDVAQSKALFYTNQSWMHRNVSLADALQAQRPLPPPLERGLLRADAVVRYAGDRYVSDNNFAWMSGQGSLHFSNDDEVGAAMFLQRAMAEELKSSPDWTEVKKLLTQGETYLASPDTPVGKNLQRDFDLRKQAEPGSDDYSLKLAKAYADSGDWIIASRYLIRAKKADDHFKLRVGRATESIAILQELLPAGSSPETRQYVDVYSLRLQGKLREALAALEPLREQPFWKTDPDAVRLDRDLNLAFLPVRTNFRAALAAQQRLESLDSQASWRPDDLLKSAWLHDLRGETEVARRFYSAYLERKPGDVNREAIVRNRLDGGPRPFFVHIVSSSGGNYHNLVVGEGVPEAQIPPIRVFANRLKGLNTSDNARFEGSLDFNGSYRRVDGSLKFKNQDLEKQQHRYRFTVEYETVGIPALHPKPWASEDLGCPINSFVFLSLLEPGARQIVSDEPETAWANTPFGTFWMIPIYGWDRPSVDRERNGWPQADPAPKLEAEQVFKLFESSVDSPDWQFPGPSPGNAMKTASKP